MSRRCESDGNKDPEKKLYFAIAPCQVAEKWIGWWRDRLSTTNYVVNAIMSLMCFLLRPRCQKKRREGEGENEVDSRHSAMKTCSARRSAGMTSRRNI